MDRELFKDDELFLKKSEDEKWDELFKEVMKHLPQVFRDYLETDNGTGALVNVLRPHNAQYPYVVSPLLDPLSVIHT